MKIAKYSDSAKKDDKSISLLKYILAFDEMAMSDYVRSGDKYPNMDGLIEIVGIDSKPIGKVEVQVKTLPNNHNYKFDMPIEPINYAKHVSDSPVLFIFSDLDKRCLYWLHISQDYIENLSIKDTQAHKTLHLDKSNIIIEGNNGYIDKWTNIINSHKSKYREYLKLKPEFEVLKELSDYSIGSISYNYTEVHRFLDFYNELLDSEFNIIKRIFYPNCWKIGIALNHYDDEKLAFSLYPILQNENNVQIRTISDDKIKEFKKKVSNMYWYSNNPIKNNYKELAIELIRGKLKIIFENYLLDINNNSYIFYCNILYDFLDKMASHYKLRESSIYKATYGYDKCSIEDLDIMVNQLLPNIIYELRTKSVNKRFFNKTINNLPIFDPFSGLAILPKSTDVTSLFESLKKNKQSWDTIALDNKHFQFTAVVNSVDILKKQGVKEVSRQFHQKDYKRLSAIKSSYIIDTWNDEDKIDNAIIYLNNIHVSYDKLLLQNFPTLYRELKYANSNIDIWLKLIDTMNLKQVQFTELSYIETTNNPSITIKIDSSNSDINTAFDRTKHSKSAICFMPTDTSSILFKESYKLLEDRVFKYLDSYLK